MFPERLKVNYTRALTKRTGEKQALRSGRNPGLYSQGQQSLHTQERQACPVLGTGASEVPFCAWVTGPAVLGCMTVLRLSLYEHWGQAHSPESGGAEAIGAGRVGIMGEALAWA